MAKAFQVDLNRCTGCQACLLACAIENEQPVTTGWRTVYTYNKQHDPALPLYHLSLACNHCDDPACLRGCPTRAYSIDAVTGAVVLNSERCMGCTYCTWMCPYGAPQFDDGAGVVQKCTFCNHRLHEGLEPACVAYCPTAALGIGERDERRGTQRVAGFTESKLGPAISLIPLRDDARIPQVAPAQIMNAPALDVPESHRTNGPAISWSSEWTLLVFTFLAPLLVGWFAAARMARVSLHPPVFIGLALAALGVSTLHLGNKSKAYLAVANWRQSWLSREILSFFTFVALSSLCALGAYTGTTPAIDALGWFAVAVGAGATFCMDMVYVAAATVDRHRWHSASALLTALFYFAILAQLDWIVFLAGAAKAALYVARKRRRWIMGRDVRAIASAVRLGIGLVAPLTLWAGDIEGLGLAAFACCLAGDIIDRSEFYDELEIVTPARQIARDQRRELQRR